MKRNKYHLPYTSCNDCVAKKENHDTPNKCPFNYTPNLKNPLRLKYRLRCSNCGTLIPCPAKYIRVGDDISPICIDCSQGYFESDYDPIEWEERHQQ